MGEGKTILVVEDDKKYRELLKEGLEGEGLTVILAPDGASGISVLKTSHVDLILLDLLMPGMDGRTFMFKMESELKLHIPVIVLTNSPVASYQSTVKDFLLKANTSLEDVVKKVKETLNLDASSAEIYF